MVTGTGGAPESKDSCPPLSVCGSWSSEISFLKLKPNLSTSPSPRGMQSSSGSVNTPNGVLLKLETGNKVGQSRHLGHHIMLLLWPCKSFSSLVYPIATFLTLAPSPYVTSTRVSTWSFVHLVLFFDSPLPSNYKLFPLSRCSYLVELAFNKCTSNRLSLGNSLGYYVRTN